MELGAEYADGLSLSTPRFELHIRPCAERSAVRIAVDADDTEYARSLALTAKELVEALDL